MMSMFKKLLASAGIGSAQVDTRLSRDSFVPGEIVQGEVYVTGGDIAQDIDEIYMYVVTHYERKRDDNTYKEECILLKHRVSERFSLAFKEQIVISFSLQLPYATPLTIGRQPVYLRTGLDIKNAVDPGDSDFIEVRAHPMMARVLDAVHDAGFQLFKVDCEYNRYLGRTYPFVQEFEFRPSGRYRNQIEELEVIFFLKEDELEVYLEIDKRAHGFMGKLEEAVHLDERYASLRLTASDRNRSIFEISSMIDTLVQQGLTRTR